MTILRACVVCSALTAESYCPEHKPQPWEASTRSDRVKLSGSAQQARAKRILQRDANFCHVCGFRCATEVDHVIPLAEGGADSDENLAAICAKPCHRDKTAVEAVRAKQRRRPGRPDIDRSTPAGITTVSVERGGP